ncbi:MAG: ROK family protein [Ruminococcaceae bacterium]|nr:ROK family protein [Oscillospiraceae bacterium]
MYYLGLDLGGTNIAAGIVNERFEIVKKGSTPTLAYRDAEEIVRDMGALCCRLMEEAGITAGEIAYAGVAVPGSVDPQKGLLVYANNLPFQQYPICEVLRRYCPVERVYLENDGSAAALGEAVAGAAKGARSSLMITLGTGVGGGIILNGKVYSGFNYAGGEVGHMVIEQGGVPCTCGRRGCWEAYSSATALKRMTGEKMASCSDSLMWTLCDGDPEKVSARTAFDAAKKGDRAGAEVVDTYIKYLACGVTNMINIFQPDVLSIGGGVSNEGDALLMPLRAIVDRDQYTRDEAIKTKICIAELKSDAGIIGAAALGI